MVAYFNISLISDLPKTKMIDIVIINTNTWDFIPRGRLEGLCITLNNNFMNSCHRCLRDIAFISIKSRLKTRKNTHEAVILDCVVSTDILVYLHFR